MHRFILLASGIILCARLTALSQTNAAADLVVNGSFENGLTGWQYLPHDAVTFGQMDETEKHSGHHSFKITNKSAWGPNIYGRLVQVMYHLQPFTTYRVSCWAKGKGCGLNWLGGGPGWFTRHNFPSGDFDWQQVSFEVTADANADNYELMVASESPTVALWVDDVEFVPVKVDEVKRSGANQEITGQIQKLSDRLEQLKNLPANPYLQLGLTDGQRFLDFARTGGSDGRLSRTWIKLQLQEVAQVLDETEHLVKANPSFLAWQQPPPGKVKLKNGLYYENGRSHYFAGYGHFGSVIDDLSNFPAFGASLIQDARAGPSSMNANGTLGDGAIQVLQGLDRAARFGMREDFLLSPHYYPAWASAPDLDNGNIGWLRFNIFHPKAKATMEKWIEVMGAAIKDKPALHSICLANEPVYIASGRDSYTKPAFAEYLQQKHQHIASLNALYGTSYHDFTEVPVPPPAMPTGVTAQRAYYDWTCFNKKMFADWHAWLSSTLKDHGVKAPTHTKIMVFQTLDRDKLAHGVDPELMCRATDLAGCDAYAFMTGANTYDWFGHEFYYDLLHSFRGQGVFDSENHVIPDGAPPSFIPMNQTRSALWQGGLHHQVSTTIWVWETAADSSLAGSIYFRPANIYGAGRAMLDLNRLAPEVTAINTDKPRVALLYSQSSIFWEAQYQGTLRSLYTMLNFMGEKITFVSERQLAEGTAAKVQWLIIPNATHVLPSTVAAIAAFTKSGGKVLLIGKGSLSRDEYDRPLKPEAYPTIELTDGDPAMVVTLRQTMSPFVFNDLRDASTGQPAWGVEFRVVQQGRTTLVPLNNFNAETKKVTLPRWSKTSALDLLSGEQVDLKAVSIEPMSPRLLRLGTSTEAER